MTDFTLKILSATQIREIPHVTSFVGEDSSGSFGLLADHDRFMTILIVGLARFRANTDTWQYLALPGAVLYFQDNLLTLSTRSYLLSDDYMRISQGLQEQLLTEEEKLQSVKQSLHKMEENLFRRLWEIRRPESV